MDLIHIPYFTSLKAEFIRAIDSVWVSDERVLIITKMDEVYGIGESLLSDSERRGDIHEPRAISNLNGKKVKDFIFGEDFVIAVNKDGQLFSWGVNGAGQLGLGNTVTTYTPTLITSLSSKKVIKVICREDDVFALCDDGELFSWGSYDNLSPTKAMKLDHRVTDIAAVLSENMLFSDFALFCVEDGALKTMKGEVILSDNVKNIVCGTSHMLVLQHDGTLRSTGSNYEGQLGIGRKDKKSKEVCVQVLNIPEKIVEIASLLNTCAAKTERNRIYVWGACRGRIVTSPYLTSYSTFNEVFLNCLVSDSFKTYGALKLSSMLKSTKNIQCNCLEVIEVVVDFNERSKSSDFTIVVEEKEIFVHREILRQRSSYFKSMLNESWSENDKNVLHVEDFTYETFKMYLRCLYGMDVNVTPENVMELMMIAHRYMDEKLENLIMEKSENDEFMKMSVDAVKKILEFPPQAFRITSSAFKFMYPPQ